MQFIMNGNKNPPKKIPDGSKNTNDENKFQNEKAKNMLLFC